MSKRYVLEIWSGSLDLTVVHLQALEYGAKKLWNVEFTSMLSLSSERPIPINVALDGNKWTVSSPSNITSFPLNVSRRLLFSDVS